MSEVTMNQLSIPQTMQAIVKQQPTKGFSWLEVPVPVLNEDQVLIKVHKSTICGTDLHIFKWDAWAQKTMQLPLIIGHEFFGEVVALGSYAQRVTHLQIGDRVSAEGHITCGECRQCRAGERHHCPYSIGLGIQRPGAFANYVALPYFNVYPIPDAVNDEMATLLDPFGNAVHSMLEFDLIGEDVLITGAGPIGLMSAAIARYVGARHVVITDVDDYRLDLARQFNVTRAVNVGREKIAEVMQSLGIKNGFMVALEMSGQPNAMRDILTHVSFGGKIVMLGIPAADFAIDWHQVVFKSLTVKGVYGRRMFETWYKAISMIESGLNIQPVITHHFPAADFMLAFELMMSGRAGKVVLDWE